MFYEGNSNKDCKECAFSSYYDDGGGDYSEMIWYCNKMDADISFKKSDNKPCGLSEGEYYESKYYVNKK